MSLDSDVTQITRDKKTGEIVQNYSLLQAFEQRHVNARREIQRLESKLTELLGICATFFYRKRNFAKISQPRQNCRYYIIPRKILMHGFTK